MKRPSFTMEPLKDINGPTEVCEVKANLGQLGPCPWLLRVQLFWEEFLPLLFYRLSIYECIVVIVSKNIFFKITHKFKLVHFNSI